MVQDFIILINISLKLGINKVTFYVQGVPRNMTVGE